MLFSILPSQKPGLGTAFLKENYFSQGFNTQKHSGSGKFDSCPVWERRWQRTMYWGYLKPQEVIAHTCAGSLELLGIFGVSLGLREGRASVVTLLAKSGGGHIVVFLCIFQLCL